MGRRRPQGAEEVAYAQGYREGVIATHTAAIKRAVAPLLAYEASQVASSILSAGLEGALKALGRIFGTSMRARWKKALEGILAPVMEDATRSGEPLLGVSFDLENDFMRKYFDEYTDRIAREITDASRDATIRAIQTAKEQDLGVAQAADLVRRALGDAAPQRAERIARTELSRATNGALYLQVAESGFYAMKTHVHQGDSRVRNEHHFTETVPIKERYQNGEYWSGQFSVNCRCVDRYSLVGFEEGTG